MRSRADPAVMAALTLHQPTGVRAEDIQTLRTKRDHRKAVTRMRKAWGSDAATALQRLQEAQMELGRLLAKGCADALAHREVVAGVSESTRSRDREVAKRG